VKQPVRVVVVEDHPLYRSAVVTLVSGMAGWTVVGAYADAETALAAAEQDAPDLVVLDLGLPGADGTEALRRFRATRPDVRVLVLTMSEEPSVLGAALRAGASGYLVKGAEPEDIERALQGVARGQAVFGEQVAAALLDRAAQRSRGDVHAGLPGLTSRELEVLELVATGHTNAEIADALFVTEKTARNHVSSVLTKLGVSSRAAAVARARDAGLGTPKQK
jgi:DNA-binding NarL/FixJ family response regulator